jgi:hypothetical protein
MFRNYAPRVLGPGSFIDAMFRNHPLPHNSEARKFGGCYGNHTPIILRASSYVVSTIIIPHIPVTHNP